MGRARPVRWPALSDGARLEDQAVINVFSSPWLTTDVRCESGHQVIEVSGSQQEQVRVVYAPGPSGC